MTNPVLQAIADRRSNRGYQPEQITKEQLDILLTAAQQAPSASNKQPWFLSVVQNQEIVKEVNEEASKIHGREGDIFYGAPTVIFVSCDRSTRWGLHDCAYAVQNIALAAHAIGLGSVILGLPDAAFTGPRKDYFNQLLKFPEGHGFAVAIAIGIPTVTKDAHPIHPDRVVFLA
ncbi:MAG: nitroreductase [Symbiobacteriaceae bacterium]|nr:nitroreductase [Symbiobacteriaceae bacterium]